jgi:hypothetical protein
MAWFKNKPDPISDRERALKSEIAQLESQIKALDSRLQRQDQNPRLRSTALPHGTTVTHETSPAQIPETQAPAHEPIFEVVDRNRLESSAETLEQRDFYNDLGVRKYDLPGLFRRFRSHFRGRSTTNPKLVSYLAAGGIQGLRPLRYEKRVARNRFIAFVLFLLLMLLGLIAAVLKH